MSLPRFGVTRPVPVNILMVGLIIAGVASGLSLTREFFPETTPDSATVLLPYPGATPEEIEESLAKKVEDKLFDLDEVEQMTTTLNEGAGSIFIEFRDGIGDVGKATDEVERAIDALRDLPEEAERIQVTEFEPVLPTIMVSLFGTVDEEVLKRAIRDIRDDLQTLPNMGEMSISGVRDYEIRVDVSADALLEHSLSLPQVADAVTAWMKDVPGGTVRTGVGNFNVRTMGVEERASAIRDIVVRGTLDGQVLRVGDIADVREFYVDEQLEMRFRSGEAGGPAANLTVFKVGDQDAVRIAEMVRAYVAGRQRAAGDESAEFEPKLIDRIYQLLNSGGAESSPKKLMTDRRRAYDLGLNAAAPLPAGCRIETSSDLARFIEGRLDLLTRNAKWGALLVFLTLLAFLTWRAAFWVGVGLVTALAGTLLMMSLVGITLNLLTMFGLIVVLGLLVDDAIVVAENITARHDRNDPALVSAIKGTEDVFWPVVATVLTTIVAFLPLTFIKGTIGDLLGALPWVVTCALLMSLVESILILPSHLGHSLVRVDKRRAHKRKTWVHRFEVWRDHLILERVVPAYARVLALAMRFRYISLSIALATLIFTLGIVAAGKVEFTFIATSDSETLVIELEMPIGTPLQRTGAVVQAIEDAAMLQPETKTTSSMYGASVSLDDMSGVAAGGLGTHVGQVFVELLPTEERTRDSEAVEDSIRGALQNKLDDVERIGYSAVHGGPGGKDITVQVTGEDEAIVDTVVQEVKDLLALREGVQDIADDKAVGQREIQVKLKPGAGGLGFDVVDIARQVRGSLFGIDAHVFSASREDIDVRVRLDEDSRTSLHTIENLWVIGRDGKRVPLREIATLVEDKSFSTIRRIDRKRATSVTADTAVGVSPETIVEDLREDVDRLRQQYPSVGIEFAGRQRQFAKAFESLPVGFLVALVMVYIILAWLFSSYTQPLAVMAAIPFGIVGVIWGHWILGFELTFLSLIGFVALSGIVVNDSLILVQFYNVQRADGLSLIDALVAAGRQRLRPIMLTTITTVLGLTPLMLEQSFQARFLIPMAISVAFGLMGATVLILLVLPCIMVILDDIKAASHFLWFGGTPPVNSVPAQESDAD